MNGRQRNSGKDKQTFKKKDSNKRNGNKRPDLSNDRSDSRTVAGPNDPSWYANNPSLLRDTANYPYGWPLGASIDLYGDKPDVLGSVGNDWINGRDALPGTMALHWAPTIGNSDDPNSPINLASRALYTYVRHVNSGASNYQAPDMMLYILSMDSVYSWWSTLRRLYGVMMGYSITNRYFPRALVKTMGFNYDDIKSNISQLRAHINQLAVRMASFAVPASMSYNVRHMWLNEGIYMDSLSTKAQTYMFVQSKYFQFGYNDETKIGELKYIHPNTEMTFAQLVEFTDSLLNPIAYDGDFNIMSGDILKAFGSEGIMKVVATDPSYVVVPAFNAEVLAQIQNSTAFGPLKNDLAVSQIIDDLSTDTYLQAVVEVDYKESLPGTYAYYTGLGSEKRLVTFDIPNPTPEDTVVATRFTNNFIIEDNKAIVTTAASDIVEYYSVIFYSEHAVGDRLKQYNRFHSYLQFEFRNSVPEFEGLMEKFNLLANMTCFNYAPTVNAVILNVYESATYVSKPFQDFNTYTILGTSDLSNMAGMALQSMFSVPLMGAWNTRI